MSHRPLRRHLLLMLVCMLPVNLVVAQSPNAVDPSNPPSVPTSALVHLRVQTDQSVSAVDLEKLFPETQFAPEIQSPEQFFGFPLGSRHLRHHQLVDYARYLADTSPRLQLLPYATSHGGRPLLVLIATDNADQLDVEALQARRRILVSGQAEPRADDRSIVYLGYSIHGDEASGANAFPAVAYYLAAGQDARLDQIRKQSILLLDPCLNPDGSDRFANWANENRGLYASPAPDDREHQQPWPGGRTNYYWFDLNRDWLPTTHPESQGRIQLFHQWRPNVLLDFHEMGSTSSYFFQPGIPARNNPLTPDTVFQWTRRFAEFHAAAFDQAAEAFFTEERYDDFYMGKGSTYPDLHGAIGILFEQGSTRGLIQHNDQWKRTFADTVANQIRSSLSSIDATNALHNELLSHQREFYQQALDEGQASETTAYLLHAHGDYSRPAAAAELLTRHSIDCWLNANPIRVDGTEHAPGTLLVIPNAQPEFRFLHSLMQRDQSFPENIFYDVSTWTLPLAMDLETINYQNDIPNTWRDRWQPVTPATDATEPLSDWETAAGFAIDPVHLDSPKLIARLLRSGIHIRAAGSPFRLSADATAEADWPAGTWLILRAANQDNWPQIAKQLTAAHQPAGPRIEVIPSGLTPIGPDLGSSDNEVVPEPHVVLIVGGETSSYDAGSLWFFLDQRLQLPVTLLDADRITRFDFRDTNCVILPGGRYSGWGNAASEKLESFVNDGGTLIATESAIDWLLRRELIDLPKPDADEAVATKEPKTETSPAFGKARSQAALDNVAGAIFTSQIDMTHPLAFGFPDAEVPLFRTSARPFPLPDNPYQAAARYQGVAAGYVSERNRDRLRHTTGVWATNRGAGRIICLADDPVFRGYFRGSERFLTNAILLGPTLRIPAAPN